MISNNSVCHAASFKVSAKCFVQMYIFFPNKNWLLISMSKGQLNVWKVLRKTASSMNTGLCQRKFWRVPGNITQSTPKIAMSSDDLNWWINCLKIKRINQAALFKKKTVTTLLLVNKHCFKPTNRHREVVGYLHVEGLFHSCWWLC